MKAFTILSLSERLIHGKCIYSESRGEAQVKLLISLWFQACCEESFTKGCKAVAAHWIIRGTLCNPNAWASPEREADLLDWDIARAPGCFKFPQVILLCSQTWEVLPEGITEQSLSQLTDCGGVGVARIHRKSRGGVERSWQLHLLGRFGAYPQIAPHHSGLTGTFDPCKIPRVLLS